MNKDTAMIFVLFGATGDLSQKKIMPALRTLFEHGDIADNSTIIAFSRRPWSDAEYRAFIRPHIETEHSSKSVEAFLERVIYIQGTFDETSAYEKLSHTIASLQQNSSLPVQTIFHIAIQPEFYQTVFNELGKAGFGANKKSEDLQQKLLPRIIIEKPFGSDIQSAENLQATIEQYFSEQQIYRIDHYLGKEGLRAVATERQANSEFEKTLSNEHVQSLHFKIFETLDIQDRGEFYEQIGALRDIGQNHLIEMLATTMTHSPDVSPEARAVILQKLPHVTDDFVQHQVYRAQYEGYRQEKEVSPSSETETFFRIETTIDNERWQGVPLILEGGKALPERTATITIDYKNGTQKVFDIQKTISELKPDAYETLILEVLQGSKQWFVSSAEITASWNFITPIVERFKNLSLSFYKKATQPHIH